MQDLPPGWAPKPNTSTNTSGLTAKLVSTTPSCKPFRGLLGNSKTSVKAKSTSFTDGSVTIDNTVSVYPDVAHATQPFAAVKRNNGFTRCFQQVLQTGLRALFVKSGHSSQITNLKVAVQTANPGTTAGDDQLAFAATFGVTVQGIDTSLYFEDVIVRVGRATDSFSFENDSNPISDTMSNVIATSVGRLSTALGTPNASPSS